MAVCCLFFALTAFGQSDRSYVDSQQRFTIQVPPGWVARPFNAGGVSGVTIAHGADAYVQIFLQKGIDPASFLKALNSGIQTNHPGYRISDRGVRDVGGESRMFIMGESPVSASAPHTQVYLETFASGGYSFAIIASASDQKAPSKEKIPDYEVAKGVIQSLSLNNQAVAHNSNVLPPTPPAIKAPVPPPAPAPEVKPVPPVENSTNLTDDQKKMAALESALKSGTITREEYIAKKNDLLTEESMQQAQFAKLKLLDQAFESGILTKEEYERKKKELEASPAPPASPSEPAPAATVASVNATPPVAESTIPPPPSVKLEPPPAATPSPEPVAAVPKPVEAPVPEPAPILRRSPAAWVTHNDPAGFAVSLPPTWTVSDAGPNGQIFLRGTRGEEILIWPLQVQKPQLNAHDTSVLIQSLALRFDALMPWGPVQTLRNVARTIGIGGDRSGTAILSWTDNPDGASAYFCAVEAPSAIYENSTDSFLAILRSFHIVSNSPIKNLLPTAVTAGKELNFVNWNDPHENAFSVSVPQGWHVIGGTYRLSPVDVRYAVSMDSPDGQIHVSIGDPMVGEFTQPSPTLTAAGLTEGNYKLLDDGSKLEVLQYLSGQKFGKSYVDTLVSRQCSHPQFTYGAPREDLAAIFSQSAVEDGFKDGFLTAGEVNFTCSLDGRTANGKFIAATLRVGHDEPSMWFVYRLYGYVALAGREQEGDKILTEILQTLKFNSKWQELKKVTSDPTVEEENPFSQQIQQRAEEDIIDDQRQISEMIARSYEQRKRVFDAVDHKLESAVLGTIEIEDRENGTRYKINDFSDYHFMSNDAYIYSAKMTGVSEANLRELLALPTGI